MSPGDQLRSVPAESQHSLHHIVGRGSSCKCDQKPGGTLLFAPVTQVSEHWNRLPALDEQFALASQTAASLLLFTVIAPKSALITGSLTPSVIGVDLLIPSIPSSD
jgi:hypothetical protein